MEPLTGGLPPGTVPVPWFLAIAVIVGVIAALVMDWPMSRQPEGFTPAYIAAGVLTRTPARDVRFRTAMVAHHLAGGLAGLLYALVALGVDRAMPTLGAAFGVSLPAHLLAVVAVVGFIYAFFAHLVLPRAGGRPYEEQATAVRGQWLRSALVYGATVLIVVPAIVVSVAG
ncbi:hypothetical protein [Halonotius roseus]|uniref:DUF2938 family protein n=1 Tax=Halonotius roseus TaxID=2511997 RepID=A0A544QPM9_9EURY|nr:hypothetical protein [Halonotius roseus]TQQ81404.1 hypothetical protein EWF95_00200 [Halonotius roseus]